MKSAAAETSRPLVITNWILQLGYKQLMACLFAVSLLTAVILTRNHSTVAGLARFDFLFLFAVGFQMMLIVLRLEHWREVLVIIIFHILAMFMEYYKIKKGMWSYPAEDAFFRIFHVPLFAGFLYSAVGSYIARSWRLFAFRFENYPPVIYTVVIAVIAYFNFYTHHYDQIPDVRWPLIIASIVLFRKCWVYYTVNEVERKFPLLPALLILSFLIWIAENIGSYAKGWAYPHQEDGWQMVHLGKISSWYLLMLLSFVLVSLVQLKSLRAETSA